FRDIMQATNLRQVRHFYMIASQRVHAGATGSAAHIQATPHGGAYLTGPGDTGLALPASATLRALVQCTGEFATHALAAYEARPEPVVQFMTLRRLANEAGAAFDAVETKLAEARRGQGLR